MKVKNNNDFETWNYQCGFDVTETEDFVYYKSEIMYFEKDTPQNAFGILVAEDFHNRAYTEKIECKFEKKIIISDLFETNCQKCILCYYDKENDYIYTCGGMFELLFE